MELGLLGNLWANCALGQTILTIPTIGIPVPGVSQIPFQAIQASLPMVPLIDTSVFLPNLTNQLANQIGNIEKIEQLDTLDSEEKNFDEESQQFSESSDSDESQKSDDNDSEKNDDANKAVVSFMLNMIKKNETEPEKKTKKKRKTYQRIRYDREEYRCTLCSYTCTTERAFLKHLRCHASDDKERGEVDGVAPRLSCPICGKDRSGEQALNKHMEKHRVDKNFCCDICAFKTVQLKKLIQHRRMHTGERPHLCPHCSYRSARRDNLRSHVRRVHKRDDLKCDTFNPRGMLINPTPTTMTIEEKGEEQGDEDNIL